MDMLLHWSSVAIDATGLDHTPVAAGETRHFGEQLGPARAARAMAIVHIAMYDAMNAIAGNRDTYVPMPEVSSVASLPAAIAVASHDSLVAMFPSQVPVFDITLLDDLARIPDSQAKKRGMAVGALAARLIVSLRSNDGSQYAEPIIGVEYLTGTAPGQWQQDPISHVPIALGAFWGQVLPFSIPAVKPFRAPAPPKLTSKAYRTALAEVKAIGGVTSSTRTEDQTNAAIYWAYDGVPSLCAPPRLYNQLTVQIADQMGTSAMQTARLLALVNIAMADAALVAWDTKFHYTFWRPITAVRLEDPTWTPLGAPASNLTGPNFTPPFPGYTSGHATLGGAVFQVLRRFYGTDAVAFTFVSDELNGVTVDNMGVTRPLLPRTFSTFSQAEEENGQSRIYLGIHFAFDKTAGIEQGNKVGNYVFTHAFQK